MDKPTPSKAETPAVERSISKPSGSRPSVIPIRPLSGSTLSKPPTRPNSASTSSKVAKIASSPATVASADNMIVASSDENQRPGSALSSKSSNSRRTPTIPAVAKTTAANADMNAKGADKRSGTIASTAVKRPAAVSILRTSSPTKISTSMDASESERATKLPTAPSTKALVRPVAKLGKLASEAEPMTPIPESTIATSPTTSRASLPSRSTSPTKILREVQDTSKSASSLSSVNLHVPPRSTSPTKLLREVQDTSKSASSLSSVNLHSQLKAISDTEAAPPPPLLAPFVRGHSRARSVFDMRPSTVPATDLSNGLAGEQRVRDVRIMGDLLRESTQRETMEAEIKDLRAEVARLEKAGNNTVLDADNGASNDKSGFEKRAKTVRKESHESMERMKKEHSATLETLERTHTTEIQALRAELEAQRRNSTKLVGVETKIANVEAALRSKDRALRSKEEERDELAKVIEDLRVEIDKCQAQLDQDSRRISTEKADTEKQLKKLRTELAALQKKSAEDAARCETAARDQAAAEQDARSLREQLESTQIASEVEARNEAAVKESSVLREQLDSAQLHKMEITEKMERKDREHDKMLQQGKEDMQNLHALHAEETERLKHDAADARQRLTDLEAEKAELQTQNRLTQQQYESQLHRMQSDLEAAEREVVQTKTNLAALQTQWDERFAAQDKAAMKDAESASKAQEELQTRFQASQEQQRRRDHEYHEKTEELELVMTEAERAKAKLKELEREGVDSAALVSNLQGQLEAMHNERTKTVDEHRHALQKSREGSEASDHEISILQIQKDKLEQEVANLRNGNTKLGESVEGLRRQIEELKRADKEKEHASLDQSQRLLKRIDTLQEEAEHFHDSMTAKDAELASIVHEKQELIEGLRSDLVALQNNAQTERDTRDTEVASMRQELDERKQFVASLPEDVDASMRAYQNEISKLKEACSEMDGDLSRLRETHAVALAAQESALSGVGASLQAAEAANAAKEQELDTVKLALLGMRMNLDTVMRDAEIKEAERSEFEERCRKREEQLEKEIEDTKREMEDRHRNELKSLGDYHVKKVEAYEDEVERKLREDLDVSKADVVKLHEQLATATEQIERNVGLEEEKMQLERRLADLASKHSSEVSALQAQHAEQLAHRSSELEAELEGERVAQVQDLQRSHKQLPVDRPATLAREEKAVRHGREQDHQRAFARLNKAHEAVLLTLQRAQAEQDRKERACTAAIEELQNTHTSVLTTVKAQHQSAMEALLLKHASAVTETQDTLASRAQEEGDERDRTHNLAVGALENAHTKAMLEIRSRHDTEVAALHAMLDDISRSWPQTVDHEMEQDEEADEVLIEDRAVLAQLLDAAQSKKPPTEHDLLEARTSTLKAELEQAHQEIEFLKAERFSSPQARTYPHHHHHQPPSPVKLPHTTTWTINSDSDDPFTDSYTEDATAAGAASAEWDGKPTLEGTLAALCVQAKQLEELNNELFANNGSWVARLGTP
ncbi:hypothetical protein LTR50_006649 [Elasticomyces elasticus]|nr:hypothetical protein LTR50_006649 [Elasticomyces elasticus]